MRSSMGAPNPMLKAAALVCEARSIRQIAISATSGFMEHLKSIDLNSRKGFGFPARRLACQEIPRGARRNVRSPKNAKARRCRRAFVRPFRSQSVSCRGDFRFWQTWQRPTLPSLHDLVPSAQGSLTAEFGMGSGSGPPQVPPGRRKTEIERALNEAKSEDLAPLM